MYNTAGVSGDYVMFMFCFDCGSEGNCVRFWEREKVKKREDIN